MKEKIVGKIVGWDCSRKIAACWCPSRDEHFFIDFTFAHFKPCIGGVIEFDIVSNQEKKDNE